MLSRLANFLYASTPAEFETHLAVSQAVEQLRTACKPSTLHALAEQAAVGRVSESKVSLQRAIPLVRNSFKPFFVGSFSRRGNKTVLTGKFSMHWATKAFMTLWFGFCVLWTLSALGLAVLRSPDAWPAPLVGLGLFIFGVGLVWVCQWFARNDIEWLSSTIRNALK